MYFSCFANYTLSVEINLVIKLSQSRSKLLDHLVVWNQAWNHFLLFFWKSLKCKKNIFILTLFYSYFILLLNTVKIYSNRKIFVFLDIVCWKIICVRSLKDGCHGLNGPHHSTQFWKRRTNLLFLWRVDVTDHPT